MNRESVTYRTHEIKSVLLKNCNNLLGMMIFHIQDKNLHKFRSIFEQSNIHIDQKDYNEDTLLIIAVKTGCYDIVDYLVNNHADVNIADRNINTPLHHALKNKYFKIANLLISKKADEFLSNVKGYSPWMYLNMNSESD